MMPNAAPNPEPVELGFDPSIAAYVIVPPAARYIVLEITKKNMTQFAATPIVEQDMSGNDYSIPATRIQRKSIETTLICHDRGTWEIPPG